MSGGRPVTQGKAKYCSFMQTTHTHCKNTKSVKNRQSFPLGLSLNWSHLFEMPVVVSMLENQVIGQEFNEYALREGGSSSLMLAII